MQQQLVPHNELRGSLTSTNIDLHTKSVILNWLWGLPIDSVDLSNGRIRKFDPYFVYYTTQCLTASHDNGRHITVRTHEDIILIADQVKSIKPRHEIRLWLMSEIPTPQPANAAEMIDCSIDLVVRLLLMVDIGDLKFGFCGQVPLVWTLGSLEEWIHNYFGTPPQLDSNCVQLNKLFNARNLERVAGFEIQWTDNLADNLRIVGEDDKKVAVFHHVSFLVAQRNTGMYPKGLIDETLRTIALLLPRSDCETRMWYRKLSDTQGLDETATLCNNLRAVDRRIENFTFWRDRIIEVKQIFDEARPTTLGQWWYDRRNSFQWYTFGVAIVVLFLTLLFGLIQCIEGAIQIHVALHPLRAQG